MKKGNMIDTYIAFTSEAAKYRITHSIFLRFKLLRQINSIYRDIKNHNRKTTIEEIVQYCWVIKYGIMKYGKENFLNGFELEMNLNDNKCSFAYNGGDFSIDAEVLSIEDGINIKFGTTEEHDNSMYYEYNVKDCLQYLRENDGPPKKVHDINMAYQLIQLLLSEQIKLLMNMELVYYH